MVAAKLSLKLFIIRTIFKILTCICLLIHLGRRYWHLKGAYKFIYKATLPQELSGSIFSIKKIEILGFPGGAVVENLPASAGNTGSSPGLGRSHMPRSS